MLERKIEKAKRGLRGFGDEADLWYPPLYESDS